MNKKSTIDNLSKEYLCELIDNSNSYSEIIQKLGYPTTSFYYKKIKQKIKEYSIDVSSLNVKRSILYRNSLIVKEVLSYNSIKHKSFSTIRRFILKHGLKEYKCIICDNNGSHFGKDLTLQLDHIDGNRTNNELDNLRWLCPNCHSQTETFSNKRKNKKVINICSCGNKIGKKNISGECSSCLSKKRIHKTKFDIDKSLLEKLLETNSLTSIGKLYGVSDNTVRKRIIKLGINNKDT